MEQIKQNPQGPRDCVILSGLKLLEMREPHGRSGSNCGQLLQKKKRETHISSQTCVQMKNTMTSRTEKPKYSLCVFREVSVAQGMHSRKNFVDGSRLIPSSPLSTIGIAKQPNKLEIRKTSSEFSHNSDGKAQRCSGKWCVVNMSETKAPPRQEKIRQKTNTQRYCQRITGFFFNGLLLYLLFV